MNPLIISYIAQVASALAIVVGMQCKGMKALLFWQSMGNLTVALGYCLIGEFSGGLICLFAVGQGAVMYLYNKKGRKPHAAVLAAFIAVSLTSSAITAYLAPEFSTTVLFAAIFSAAGASLYTLSIAQSRANVSRLIYLFNPICWILYDALALPETLVIFLVHIGILISTAVGIVRVDILGKKNKSEEIKA